MLVETGTEILHSSTFDPDGAGADDAPAQVLVPTTYTTNAGRVSTEWPAPARLQIINKFLQYVQYVRGNLNLVKFHLGALDSVRPRVLGIGLLDRIVDAVPGWWGLEQSREWGPAVYRPRWRAGKCDGLGQEPPPEVACSKFSTTR